MKRIFAFFALLMICAGNSAWAKTEVINGIAAIVNDDVITTLELEQETENVKKQLLSQGTRIPPHKILLKQILEREINKRTQLQFAKATGIRVDDTELNNTLDRIAQQNKMNLRELKNALENEGFNFSEYREMIRKDMILARLRQREVINRIAVSEQEVQNFIATQTSQGNIDDEYNISQILIPVPEAASADKIQKIRKHAQEILKQLDSGADFGQIAISESSGQNALEGGKLGWRKAGQLPTIFATQVIQMQPGEHSDLIRSSSGFHIIRLNDKRSGEKHIVTQSKARHILMTPSEFNTEQEIIARLRQLRQRVLAGDDFAELAKSNSDDRGTALEGGDLGWVSPGQMVPQFEAAMNNLKVGEVSEPFQTQFGWHIVEVYDRRQIDNSKQVTENKAREFIRQRKTEEMTEAWARQLREEAFVEIKLKL
ncbi:MAG: peptidylprolyl isomerase [Gammaproteobacteria bacterium]|nr:peptidylprolyl isomerase [Gammaproteobacteria bacterium]